VSRTADPEDTETLLAESTARIAVLTSGGLDSAILVADLARQHRQVYPLYIRAGLSWEAAELAHLRRFLETVRRPTLQPLVVLEVPVGDLYGRHWSLTGQDVPDAHTPDEAVYLPGRNVLLATKALLWCHLHQVPILALATLRGNPFPDASEQFFGELAAVVSRAVGDQLTVQRPYAHLGKREVLARGQGLPLEWTFSCIRPVEGGHCGNCNKCAERRKAFAEAGWNDPTEYAGGRRSCTA
jgi:7-cyano-7-deazaguanine synthase